jgi:hypothetical protein
MQRLGRCGGRWGSILGQGDAAKGKGREGKKKGFAHENPPVFFVMPAMLGAVLPKGNLEKKSFLPYASGTYCKARAMRPEKFVEAVMS